MPYYPSFSQSSAPSQLEGSAFCEGNRKLGTALLQLQRLMVSSPLDLAAHITLLLDAVTHQSTFFFPPRFLHACWVADCFSHITFFLDTVQPIPNHKSLIC